MVSPPLASSRRYRGAAPPPRGPPNFMSIPRKIYIPIENPSSKLPFLNRSRKLWRSDFKLWKLLAYLGVGGNADGLTGRRPRNLSNGHGSQAYVPDSHAGYPKLWFIRRILQNLNFDSKRRYRRLFFKRTKIDLAQVALASVARLGGLSNVGDNHFQNFTQFGFGSNGFGGPKWFGKIQGDSLVRFHVDLTVEFVQYDYCSAGVLIPMPGLSRRYNSDLQTITDWAIKFKLSKRMCLKLNLGFLSGFFHSINSLYWVFRPRFFRIYLKNSFKKTVR